MIRREDAERLMWFAWCVGVVSGVLLGLFLAMCGAALSLKG